MPNPTWLEDAIKKYRAKLNHTRLRPLLTNILTATHNKTAIAQVQNDHIIQKVRLILDVSGIDTDRRLGYYDYALSLDKSQRTLEFMVDLIREHQILRARWETIGLDADVLDKLDAVLIFRGQP